MQLEYFNLFLLFRPYKTIDLENMDPQFYKSLSWIQTNNITPDLDLTFSTTQDIGGEVFN